MNDHLVAESKLFFFHHCEEHDDFYKIIIMQSQPERSKKEKRKMLKQLFVNAMTVADTTTLLLSNHKKKLDSQRGAYKELQFVQLIYIFSLTLSLVLIVVRSVVMVRHECELLMRFFFKSTIF